MLASSDVVFLCLGYWRVWVVEALISLDAAAAQARCLLLATASAKLTIHSVLRKDLALGVWLTNPLFC